MFILLSCFLLSLPALFFPQHVACCHRCGAKTSSFLHASAAPWSPNFRENSGHHQEFLSIGLGTRDMFWGFTPAGINKSLEICTCVIIISNLYYFFFSKWVHPIERNIWEALVCLSLRVKLREEVCCQRNGMLNLWAAYLVVWSIAYEVLSQSVAKPFKMLLDKYTVTPPRTLIQL